MSESSIYWTAGELNAMGIEEAKYSDYKANVYDIETDLWNEIKNENNEQYYYAYSDGNKLIYKNISIVNKDKKENGAYESLLQNGLFGCPYFETASCLIIPTERNKDRNPHSIPKNSNIMFTLDKSFESKAGVGIGSDFISNYMTGNTHDVIPPEIVGHISYNNILYAESYNSGFLIGRIETDAKLGFSPNPKELIYQETNVGLFEDENNIKSQILTEDEIKNAEKIEDLFNDGRIKLLGNTLSLGYFYNSENSVDFPRYQICDTSGIKEVIFCFEPIDNKFYPNQIKEPVYQYNLGYSDSTFNLFYIIVGNSKELTDGIYRLKIYAIDTLGNKTKFKFATVDRNWSNFIGDEKYYYMDVFFLKDDTVTPIKADDISFNMTDENNAIISGPEGKYLWLSTNIDENTNFSIECDRIIRSYNSNNQFEGFITITNQNNVNIQRNNFDRQKEIPCNLLIYMDAFYNTKVFKVSDLTQ